LSFDRREKNQDALAEGKLPKPMNAPFKHQSSTNSLAVRFLFNAVVISGAMLPALDRAQADKPVIMDKLVVNDTKTHTLFMGADIAVNLDKDSYPVKGVIGSSWVVEINGEEKVISAKQAPLNLKITPNLKLTDLSATIAGYKKERAYTFENDPSVRLTRGLSNSAMTNADLIANANAAQAIADTAGNKALGAAALFAATDNLLGAAGVAATATALASPHPTSPAPAGNFTYAMAQAMAAQYAVATSNSQAQAVGIAQQGATADFSQAENGNEPGGRLVQTGFDAMDVEFEISSARRLARPYIVTLTRFHPKGTKPGTVQNLVYAKELHPIDKNPSNVHFTEGGFPFDFELIDFQIHVYDRGEEVATTVSSKRVELTRDEAFEYVKIEYIGSHKGATLPAAPAMALLPADLPTRLAQGEFKETFYVRVSKDGRADEAFTDATCTRRIEDPYLERVVRSIRFDPALANGKPVDGIASLDLRRLKIQI
jgi:hypothetical protein